MANFNSEVHQKLIRDKLNSEQIKLWLLPYTLENGDKGVDPKDLVARYSKEFKLDVGEIREILENLRIHAVQKLAERNEFQKEGIATLKIKLPSRPSCKKQVTSVKIKLGENGGKLRDMVSTCCDTTTERIKLISSGKIIKDDISLQQQNIKNGCQIMTVILSVSEMEAIQKEKDVEQISKTRKAAELLSVRAADDDTQFDVQIADQSGRPLKLPKEEKQALTLAMTLHEKGRSLLKNKNIASALLLLLEADMEFRKCRASILDAVDNYAVLCLDIVWCYLCLENLDELPDAEKRLKASEECLIRSYGSHLERLTAVKGESSTAMVLFMKLHLLQGIVAYHQHDVNTASQLLKQADDEIKKINVDPDQITQVMSMGFGERESRLGLRACDGNIQRAVDYIMKKRQEKDEILQTVKADRKNRKQLRKLGKTANGEWVNENNFEMLIKMGFNRGPSGEALRQANNDVSVALDILNTNPELLNIPDPVDEDTPITDTMIAQLTVLGFEAEMCRRALIKHHGNSSRAVEDLIQAGGFLSPVERSHGSGSSSSSSKSSSESSDMSTEDKEILNDLVSDIKQDGDEYLDNNLEDEKQCLSEYLSLINSINS